MPTNPSSTKAGRSSASIVLLVAMLGAMGCQSRSPVQHLSPLTEIQRQLALPDDDWDQILALVGSYDGMTVFNATHKPLWTVTLNLIEADPTKHTNQPHPTITVEKRGSTWVVTKGPEAGLTWRGPYTYLGDSTQ